MEGCKRLGQFKWEKLVQCSHDGRGKKGGGRKGPEILCFGFSGRGMWGFSLLKRNEDRYYEWI